MKIEEIINNLENRKKISSNPNTVIKLDKALFVAKKVELCVNAFKEKGYSLRVNKPHAGNSYYLHCDKLNYGTRISDHSTYTNFEGENPNSTYVDYVNMMTQKILNFINKK